MKTTILSVTLLLLLVSCNTTTPIENTTQNMKNIPVESSSGEDTEITSLVSEEVYAEDILNGATIIQDISSSELSEIELTSLLQMREEEKLAHDVYLTLYEMWGQQIFSNIASSEQTHTDSVKTLLDRYDIVDPVTDNTIGVFSSPDIQELYDTFVEQGNKSLYDALIVGATIEDLDIKDIQDFSTQIDNEDILLVYSNLERGSRNHMRSFSNNISRIGETYVPQYISQAEYDEIISSTTERGGNTTSGMSGNGENGNGNGGNGKNK